MEYIQEKKEPAFARSKKMPPHPASSQKQYATGSVRFYIQQKPDSPAPLLGLNGMESGIIQRKTHVQQKEPLDFDEISLRESTKPTMVFESMGSKEEDADALYQMTKRYTGNTICVFGINTRYDALDPKRNTEDDALGSKFPATPEKKNDSPHFLRCFSFLWKKPAEVGEDMPYKMPFVEARLLVMRNAQELISDHVKKPPADNPGSKFIYRWIDADAHGDTSDNIPADKLNDFSKSADSLLGTGTYNWRHSENRTAANCPVYHAFIEQINTEEHSLRAFYYEVMSHSRKDKKEIITDILKIDHGKSITEKDRQQKKFLSLEYLCLECLTSNYTPQPFSNGNYLPGYYLPESTLLMNQAAHDNILCNSPSINKEAQDKESMKLAERSGCDPKNIRYFDTLSVTKPLKNEFNIEKNKGSYFFNANMKAFFENLTFDRKLMNNAFGSLRQSIFSKNWKFDNDFMDNLLKAKRKEALDRLQDFLTTPALPKGNNFLQIKKSLPF